MARGYTHWPFSHVLGQFSFHVCPGFVSTGLKAWRERKPASGAGPNGQGPLHCIPCRHRRLCLDLAWACPSGHGHAPQQQRTTTALLHRTRPSLAPRQVTQAPPLCSTHLLRVRI